MKKDKEDWIQKKWRPMMAMMYMVVCIFDFIVFPIGFTIVQFWETQAANDAFRQWQPLTLVGAGLFHMAMGAVLGITAWSRGQEKIAGVSAGPSMPLINTASMSNQGGMMSGGVMPAAWNSPQQDMPVYREMTTDTVSPVVAGYKGKKAPVEPNYPEI